MESLTRRGIKKPDWNHKNNARLFWFAFTVWFSSYPSALLHVVSITNFLASKISCSVFETGISFRFVVPTFESFSASFSPVCRPLIYEQVRELGVKLRHVVHEDWLVSSLSLHVLNMVLAKMNNYEYRSKPIYASYTFQVLMSFWFHVMATQHGIRKYTRDVKPSEILSVENTVRREQWLFIETVLKAKTLKRIWIKYMFLFVQWRGPKWCSFICP